MRNSQQLLTTLDAECGVADIERNEISGVDRREYWGRGRSKIPSSGPTFTPSQVVFIHLLSGPNPNYCYGPRGEGTWEPQWIDVLQQNGMLSDRCLSRARSVKVRGTASHVEWRHGSRYNRRCGTPIITEQWMRVGGMSKQNENLRPRL